MKKSDVISHFGSGVEVAKALGISTAAVYQWPDEVPHLRACQIELITKGELKAGNNKQHSTQPAA